MRFYRAIADMPGRDGQRETFKAGGTSDRLGLPLRRIEAGRNREGNDFRVPAFLSTHPVIDERLKALEKQVPSRQGEPLLSQEEWRALKEICKTT